MQVDTYQRVLEELHRLRRQLRAFEDAAVAERQRQLAGQRVATGRALGDSLRRADELQGEVHALVQAQEIISGRVAELGSAQRRDQLRTPESAT